MEQKKICKNCNNEKSITEFKSNGYTKKGTKQYKPHCKQCMNIMIRNSYKDTYIMVRGKPVKVVNEKRLAKNEYKREFYRNNIEEYRKKNRDYYHNLPIEVKQVRVRKDKIRRNKLKAMNG